MLSLKSSEITVIQRLDLPNANRDNSRICQAVVQGWIEDSDELLSTANTSICLVRDEGECLFGNDNPLTYSSQL
jgi:hypothetical protein